VRGSVRDLQRELKEASKQVRNAPPSGPSSFGWGYPPRPGAAKPAAPPGDVVTELEDKAAQLLAEVRRLARTGRASQETMRATLVVLDGAIDQVRRLLR